MGILLSVSPKFVCYQVESISNFKTTSDEKTKIYRNPDRCCDQETGKRGLAVKDISRELGISEATFYTWEAKYGGMDVSEVKRSKDLEAELSQYKKMYAEVSFQLEAAKALMAKKFQGLLIKDKLCIFLPKKRSAVSIRPVK